jgi:hypothetical protein
MSDRTLKDLNRREISLTGSIVQDVLPDYYKSDHPKLISFLETYYNTLDSDHSFSTAGKQVYSQRAKDADSAGTGQVTYGWDSDRNFGHQLSNIPTLRDIVQTETENLSFIEDELLLGQSYTAAGGAIDKRVGSELSNNFYRSKGTKFGIERFFRLFFGETPEIIYGKDLVMKVGSAIGPETGLKITDDTIYQFWGILIKLGIASADWMDMYKLFAHPGGMYAGASVLIEGKNADISFDGMPLSVEDTNLPTFEGQASFAARAITSLSGIIGTTSKPYDSEGSTPGGRYRIDVDQSRFDYFSTIGGTDSDTNYLGTLRHLDNTFENLVNVVRINSQTFDMDSDGSGVSVGGGGVLRMSDGQVTIDADEFKYYTDSA